MQWRVRSPRRDGDGDYRPHLDGLRAVAVYLVVGFHAEVAHLSGGFIGVDVFFVLSGYLVTRLLLRDLAANGRIGLRRFYARRYRRLLPAAFVTLLVSAAVFGRIAAPSEVDDASAAFRAAYLYVANWHFIAQSSDYFAADIDRSPVIHFWSLAVEEQFYLIWPLLLGGLFTATRRLGTHRVAAVRAVVAAAGLASAFSALHLARTNLNRAYYGTDTRGYELLAGALLALTPSLFALGARAVRSLGPLAVVAGATMIALATSAVQLATIERGIAVTLATAVLIVAIENRPDGVAARALAQPVAAYLGRLSYGTYLWHWPVIVVLTRKTSLLPYEVLGASAVLATVLAALSYHGLELRVRLSSRLDRYSAQVIAGGLALSALGGLVLAPGLLDASGTAAVNLAGTDGDPTTLDWRAARDDIPDIPTCTLAKAASCTVVRGSGQHLLLLGDSNARMYLPAFRAIAERDHLSLSVAVAPLCPWQRGLFYLIGGDPCRALKRDWYGGLLDALDPDVVILANRPMDDPADPTALFTPTGRFDPGDAGYDAALRTVTERSLTALEDSGRKVVVLEPTPIATRKEDPLVCLSGATTLDECIYRANAQRTPIEGYYESVSATGAIAALDLDQLVCPRLPLCDPVVAGLIVKRDSDHITGRYAAHLAEPIRRLLREADVLP